MQNAGFEEAVFADDLNAFKEVEKGTAKEEALEAAKKCQQEVHKWGQANQV